jgi:YD repeat-containing protein
MKIFKILSFITSLFFCSYAIAQKSLAPIIPSPNASSLGVYGELPVSLFTGIPDISIPIYELKGNKIGLPISLSYHAGGLRPEVHPSWVGNGWSLNAGGVITRKWNGVFADEYQYIDGTSNTGIPLLGASDWSSNAKIKVNSLYANLNPLDVEPDEFNFNFLGFSGKFYMDHNGDWQVQSDQYIKVVKFQTTDLVEPFIKSASQLEMGNPNLVKKVFGKFTLIDGKGNKYFFGSTDALKNTAIEFSDNMIVPYSYRGINFIATSWYLTKIVSADGTETIDLNYDRGPFTSNISHQSSQILVSTYGGSGNQQSCYNSNFPLRGGLGGSVISPVYLASISMPSKNARIDFSSNQSNELGYRRNGNKFEAYGQVYLDNGYTIPTPGLPADFPSCYTLITDGNLIPYFANYPAATYYPNLWDRFIWMKLNSISIVNTTSSVEMHKMDFSYNNDTEKRLRLLSVQMDEKKHSFTYNAQYLPDYIKIYTDHWGFNNNNSNQLPTSGPAGIPTGVFTAREPDNTGALTQAEILTEIIYPTGGKTQFIYEQNKYSSVVKRDLGVSAVTENGYAGGVRLKKMINIDNFGVEQFKEYFYVTGYTGATDPSTLPSSGVLDTKPIYYYEKAGINDQGYNCIYKYGSSTSIVPVTSTSMANHIGYNAVVEKLPDNSFTIYNFSNHESGAGLYNDGDAVNDYNPGFFQGYKRSISNYFKRGRLLKKELYKYNPTASSFFIALKEETAYTAHSTSVLVRAVHSEVRSLCPLNYPVADIRAYSTEAYVSNCTPFFPTTITSKNYASDGSGTEKTIVLSQQFDEYKNLRQVSSTKSNGDNETAVFKYPYDFATADVLNPYKALKDQHTIDEMIEKRVLTGSPQQLKEASIRTFGILGANKIYNNSTYTFESPTPVDISLVGATSYIGSGNLGFDSRYKEDAKIYYDSEGNISTLETAGGNNTGFIWGYNKKYPVAKVENAKDNEIGYASFEGENSVNNGWVHAGSIYSDLINHPPGGTKYTQLGNIHPVNALDPLKKYTVSYWCKDPASITVVPTGGNVTNNFTKPGLNGWMYVEKQISGATSFNINSSGIGSAFLDEARFYPSDASMITFLYDWRGNITTSCDARSFFLYYEYDSYGRMKIVRDYKDNVLKKYDYQYLVTANQGSGNYSITLTNNTTHTGYTYTVSIDGISYSFPIPGQSTTLGISLIPGVHSVSFQCGPSSNFNINPGSNYTCLQTQPPLSLNVSSNLTFTVY